MAVNSTTTLRLMGMSSGMDTDSIIQQMMKVSQLKIDKQNRAKTLLEWKQSSLTGVKNDLAAFRKTFLSATSSQNMRTSSVYNANVATVTGKYSSAVSVSTSYSSATGSVKIGQVVSLAKNTNVSATNVSADGKGFSTSDTLGSLKFKNGEFAFTETAVPPPEPPSQEQYMKTAYDADGNVLYEDDGTTEKKVFDEDAYNLVKDEYDRFMAEDYVQTYENKMTVSINGKDFTFKDTDTIDHMMKTINADKDAGVTMSYDRLADKFTISAKEPGVDKEVKFGEGDQLASVIGFGAEEKGTKAQAYINGELVTSDTNTFDYRGIKITLNQATTTGGRYDENGKYVESEDDTTVTVKRDATEAIKTIKGFVDSYNSLIAKLEGMLKESKSTSESKYTPLTDEEKSAMTEKQIEDWEAIAKKGILKNDSGIQSMISSLRGALFDAVEGAGMSPSAIGLSTGGFFDGTGSQIVLNEDKLKAALEKDPEQVMNIFMKTSQAGDASTKYKESGLLNRIDTIMAGYVSKDGNNTLSLDNLEKSIKNANEQIEKIQNKMYQEEERLYKKFAAMETALSKLQSQGDYFSSMLGG